MREANERTTSWITRAACVSSTSYLGPNCGSGAARALRHGGVALTRALDRVFAAATRCSIQCPLRAPRKGHWIVEVIESESVTRLQDAHGLPGFLFSPGFGNGVQGNTKIQENTKFLLNII